MSIHVFATYGTETYLVEADSEEEAKGKMWDVESVQSLEYIGTAEEYVEAVDDDVAKVHP